MSSRKRTSPVKAAPLWALLALVASTGAGAADVYLRAGTTTKVMPDGASVVQWGYVLTDATFTPLPGEQVKVPGPRITLAPSETTLSVHLFNGLTEPTSIVISGLPVSPVPTWKDGSTGNRTAVTQRVHSFTQETAPGTSSVYSWTSLKPGTYLYQSGTHPSVQVQMGLYGCVTKDFAAGFAYDGVPYSNELLLFFSEVDPALHAAVADGTYGPPGPGITMTSTIGYDPKYYLINGDPYPDARDIWNHSPVVGERVLVRFLSAGLETHVPVIQNLRMRLVAEDGNALPYPRDQYSVILPAGKTLDTIVDSMPEGAHPVYDRRGFLTNGPAGLLSGPQSPGGMITSFSVQCATPIPPPVGPSLKVAASGSNLTFTWTDIPGVLGYRLYRGTNPAPSTFSTLVGSALTGTTGITVAEPAGGPYFYLVAAVNGCSEGPQK